MRKLSGLALVLALGGPAQSQDTPGKGADGTKTPSLGSTIAPAGGVVDTSQGGVGGTGLGKMPSDNIDGKGLSVKGPAGQGVQPMQTPK